MLPKSEHVQQVYYAGDKNLLSADRPSTSSGVRKLFIECSTIDPAVSREVGAKIQESGLGDFSDAAVSVCHMSHATKQGRSSLSHRAALLAPETEHSPT